MLKVCPYCNAEKPQVDFRRDSRKKSGYSNYCLACWRAYNREYSRKPKTKRKKREYAIAHREETAAAARKYYRNHPDRRRQSFLKWRAKNPEKRAAHEVVSIAIRDGKLIKGPCEVCGSLDVDAHHDDYLKPLKVRWLCHLHHLELHWKQENGPS